MSEFENEQEIRSEEMDALEEDPKTFTFRIKRSHFYAVTVPLAFLLGMTVGYLAWGQAETPAAVAASAAEVEDSAAAVVEPPAAEEPQSVAEQIEALQRFEIPTDGEPVTGPEDAPITIVEFADFECPYCQRHFAQVYPQLQASYPDQIRYIYMDFPLTSIHPEAEPSALAAQCAFEQEAFWAYHDLLFSGDQGLSRESYEAYASQLGLDLDSFTTCLDEERYLEEINADRDFALQTGISSTPTFFINGIPIVGAQPYSVFAEVIDYELGQVDGEAP